VGMSRRRYYDPGANPQPRNPLLPGKGGYRDGPRRVPRARRLAVLAAHGIAKPTGRQWRKLRKRLRREGHR